MGWRVIDIEMPVPPGGEETALLDEVAAVAQFNGVEASARPPDRYPGDWQIVLEGNSSYLNDFTQSLIEAAAEIAADIDPTNERLQTITASIASQLREQIVDWSTVVTVTPALRGREFAERLKGEASFSWLEEELRIHAERVRNELAEQAALTGPTAWRRRGELEVFIRIDSLALLTAARRLRRIAGDLRRRLPAPYLDSAIVRFDRAAPGLVALRDIAEHIDEYSLGRGRLDSPAREPGAVIEFAIQAGDVTVAARQLSLRVLAVAVACTSLVKCLTAATNHYAITYLIAPFADFDFVKYNESGTEIVSRSEETAEHAEIRAMFAGSIQRLKPPSATCGECSHVL